MFCLAFLFLSLDSPCLKTAKSTKKLEKENRVDDLIVTNSYGSNSKTWYCSLLFVFYTSELCLKRLFSGTSKICSKEEIAIYAITSNL